MTSYNPTRQQLFSVIVLIAFFTCLVPSSILAANPDKLQFAWGIFLDPTEKAKDTDAKLLSFKKPEKLKSGDSFQIYLKPLENVYLYMYLVGTDKDVTLIFPENLYTLNSSKKDSSKNKTAYFIPMGDDRIELTPPGGTEKIYLIASTKKLEKLEKLTIAYLEASDNAAKRGAVVKELDLLKRTNSKMSEATIHGIPNAGTIAVPIAGTIFRSKSFDVPEKTVYQVTADKFYLKVLRIRHE